MSTQNFLKQIGRGFLFAETTIVEDQIVPLDLQGCTSDQIAETLRTGTK
jgi:hypothetical protein